MVAWHVVPGKRAPKDPSRRVRYDPGAASALAFVVGFWVSERVQKIPGRNCSSGILL